MTDKEQKGCERVFTALGRQGNDKAVMQAYGFWGKLNTESECVAELMRMYQKMTEK